MAQNKYDDPDFFASYSNMPRSQQGLEAAGEWHVLRTMLPDFQGKTVLDLGCGFGWHCRYAVEQGAASVIGVDLSEKMLKRAQEMTQDSRITYQRGSIEGVEYKENQFDVVISSLAFHYIENFAEQCRKTYRWLKPGGSFVFSVEHPIFTSLESQNWIIGPTGERLHWPVDNYQLEGPRNTKWLTGDVTKFHRTFATYINSLVEAGFQIKKVIEPEPSPEMLNQIPELKDEMRRPMFLMIASMKP
ncbi:class I SAM-dependent methyltransferase [Bdellovibrio sp. HCB-162]|uniref:class I SAM-dependent methyltransferase n=1 Tax=Bdellovibrio sp. HCB-162 TaxID=3394234 RepID=UPI0039BCAC58